MSDTPNPNLEHYNCARLGTSYLLFYRTTEDKVQPYFGLIQSFADAAGWKKEPIARPIVVRSRGAMTHNEPTQVLVGISCGVEFVKFSDLLNGTALEKLQTSRSAMPAPRESGMAQTPAMFDTGWQKQVPLTPLSPIQYRPPKLKRHGWTIAALVFSLLFILAITVTLLPRAGQPAVHATPVVLQTPTNITATPTQAPQITPLTLQASPSQVDWTVLQGQNLTYILLALHRRATWSAIVAVARANGISNPSMINNGQTLTIGVGKLVKVPANTALVTVTSNEITVRILTTQTDLRLVEAPASYADTSYQQESNQLLQGIVIQKPPDSYQVFDLQGFNLHAKTCQFNVSTSDVQTRVRQCLAT